MAEDSVRSTIKNDIKTSFLIANTFNALVGGLFPVTMGTGWFLTEGYMPAMFYAMAVGTPMFGLCAFGFYAAFKENKNMVDVYSALTGLVVILETLAVAAHLLPTTYFEEVFYVYFCIFHTGIALAAMVSAIPIEANSLCRDFENVVGAWTMQMDRVRIARPIAYWIIIFSLISCVIVFEIILSCV